MSVGRNPPNMQRDLDSEHMRSTRGYRQGPNLDDGAMYPSRLSMQGSGQREMIEGKDGWEHSNVRTGPGSERYDGMDLATLGKTWKKLDAQHRARFEYFMRRGIEFDDEFLRDGRQLSELTERINRLDRERDGIPYRPLEGRGHRHPRGNSALSSLVPDSRPRAGMENERTRSGNGSRHEDDIASTTRDLSRLGVKSRERSNMAREMILHLTQHQGLGDHADEEADDPSYESRHGRMGSRRETAEASTKMPPVMAHPSRHQDPPDDYADDDDHHLSETGRAGARAVDRRRREAAETTSTRMPRGMGASTHRPNMTDEGFDFPPRGSRHIYRHPSAGHGRGLGR